MGGRAGGGANGGMGSQARESVSIEQLKNSKNFWINAGMNRYDSEKNDGRWDFSDMRNLSEADKTFLTAYLSNSYGEVNGALRKGELNGEMKAMVKGIDKAVGKLDKYEGTVYRGVKFQYGGTRKENAKAYSDMLAHYKANVGKVVTEKTYLSTGKVKAKIDRKFTSTDYPSIKFTIKSKTGRNVSRYNSEEKEILFGRGTKFKVTSVKGNHVSLSEL